MSTISSEPTVEHPKEPAAEGVGRPGVERLGEPGVERLGEPGAEDLGRHGAERLGEPGAERLGEPGAERLGEPGADRSTRSGLRLSSELQGPRSGSVSGHGFGHGAGFWVVAAAFLVVMAYSVVPTPLWTLYQQRDGFNTFSITIAFAAYAVGVVVSLFLAGHLSDRFGRKAILLPAIALEVISAVVFLLYPELSGLIVARVISGLGIGMLTATATAHLLDLHVASRPGTGVVRGQVVSGAVNLGGFAVGAVISGALARWVAAPLVTPYVVFLVLLVVAGLAVAFVPETVVRPKAPWVYRPQRVSVPRESRGRFAAVALVAFASFAVLGLFTSLAPVFVSGTLDITSRFVAGLVVFATFAAAALAQIVFRSLPMIAQVTLGGILLVVGTVVIAVAVVGGSSLALFLVGGVLAGAGGGVLFKSSLAIAGGLAEPARRGEVLAGIFLAGYVGLAVPAVGIGVATLSVPLAVALVGFAVFMVAVALASVIPVIVGLRAE